MLRHDLTERLERRIDNHRAGHYPGPLHHNNAKEPGMYTTRHNSPDIQRRPSNQPPPDQVPPDVSTEPQHASSRKAHETAPHAPLQDDSHITTTTILCAMGLTVLYAVAVAAVISLAVFFVEATVAHAQDKQDVSDVSYASAELEMVELINDYRADHGLEPVQVSDTASLAAKRHSEDMATYDFFDHYTMESSYFRSGAYFEERMDESGYDYTRNRSENIAAGRQGASETLQQWIESPEHNENMLRSDWEVVGIGREYGSGSTHGYYWTTDFGAYADNTARAPTEVSGGTPSTDPSPSADQDEQPDTTRQPAGQPGSDETSSPDSDTSGDTMIEEDFDGSHMEAIEELKEQVRQQGPAIEQTEDNDSKEEQGSDTQQEPSTTGSTDTTTTTDDDTADDSTHNQRQTGDQSSGESDGESGETPDAQTEQDARDIIEDVFGSSGIDDSGSDGAEQGDSAPDDENETETTDADDKGGAGSAEDEEPSTQSPSGTENSSGEPGNGDANAGNSADENCSSEFDGDPIEDDDFSDNLKEHIDNQADCAMEED